MPVSYFNGQWNDDGQLAIPVNDLGFAMGVTVVERLRTFGGQVFRQTEHIARMQRSLEIVGIHTKGADAADIAAEIDAAITGFIVREQGNLQVGAEWAIVAFATPGSGGEPTRCVHGYPLAMHEWAHQYTEGVTLRVSQHRQTPTNCWPAELKCRSRMHYYLADQQAHALEPGARAVLLDQEGYLGEASTANLVLYNQQQGILSPRMEKVLPGVSVAVVREMAAALGIPFTERDLTVKELLAADEVWLASTSVCMLPVVRCEGQPIGDGKPGEVYKKVLAEWGKLVGVDIAVQATTQP